MWHASIEDWARETFINGEVYYRPEGQSADHRLEESRCKFFSLTFFHIFLPFNEHPYYHELHTYYGWMKLASVLQHFLISTFYNIF